MKLMLDTAYSDNGEFSHHRILDAETGKNLLSEDPEEDNAKGFPVEISIFEKMWNTLKAESGYRKTISHFAHILDRDDLNSTLKELMENMEQRASEQLTAST
jgi:hypothetical protein